MYVLHCMLFHYLQVIYRLPFRLSTECCNCDELTEREPGLTPVVTCPRLSLYVRAPKQMHRDL